MSAGGEDVLEVTGEGRVCVTATAVSPVWQHSLVHCSNFTHKNYMKNEIIFGDICTVLKDIIKNLLALCSAIL